MTGPRFDRDVTAPFKWRCDGSGGHLRLILTPEIAYHVNLKRREIIEGALWNVCKHAAPEQYVCSYPATSFSFITPKISEVKTSLYWNKREVGGRGAHLGHPG